MTVTVWDGWSRDKLAMIHEDPQGEVRRVAPAELNCWEAGWYGPDGIVAITSDVPGEDDSYQAVLSHIDVRSDSPGGQRISHSTQPGPKVP